MGMWMLLLRTVPMEKSKTAWFAVNGVPVRYSLKEYALISGLNCHSYPPEYENLGSLRFVKRHFGRTVNISVGEVKEKLKKMAGGRERLKMAVLLFLCTVLKGSKRYGHIDPFILRIVDDLKACSTFPWGRYTFDDCIEEIFRMMDHFKGCANPTWCFPGFIYPLEVLACESIPQLRKLCREDVPTADPGCPRMCKQRWQKPKSGGYLKGFPLEDINEALGETEEIISVLQPDPYELALLSRILEDDVDDEEDGELSRNWNKCLVDEKKKIFWQDLFESDKAGRAVAPRAVTAGNVQPQSGNIPAGGSDAIMYVLTSFQANLMKAMGDGFAKMNERIGLIEKKIAGDEAKVEAEVEGDDEDGDKDEADDEDAADSEESDDEGDSDESGGDDDEDKEDAGDSDESDGDDDEDKDDAAGVEAEDKDEAGAGDVAEDKDKDKDDAAGVEAEAKDEAGDEADRTPVSIKKKYERRRGRKVCPSRFVKSPYA